MAETLQQPESWLARLNPKRVGCFLLRRRVRLVLAWLLALGATVAMLCWAWTHFDDPDRRDGNAGHVFIDFGGQWTATRMLVEGQGEHLYDLSRIRPMLERHYPANENISAGGTERTGAQDGSDADELYDSLSAVTPQDSHLGGVCTPRSRRSSSRRWPCCRPRPPTAQCSSSTSPWSG